MLAPTTLDSNTDSSLASLQVGEIRCSCSNFSTGLPLFLLIYLINATCSLHAVTIILEPFAGWGNKLGQILGISLVVQWLGLSTPTLPGPQVQFLVQELRYHPYDNFGDSGRSISSTAERLPNEPEQQRKVKGKWLIPNLPHSPAVDYSDRTVVPNQWKGADC